MKCLKSKCCTLKFSNKILNINTFKLYYNSIINKYIIKSNFISANSFKINTNDNSIIIDWKNMFIEPFSFELYKNNSIINTNIKCIVFDLNNVLVEINKKNYTNISELNILDRILKSNTWQKLLVNLIEVNQFYTDVANELNLNCEEVEKALYKALNNLIEIDNNSLLPKILHRKGYIIACITNLFSNKQDFVFNKFDFLECFDIIITSGDLKVKKPNLKIFINLLNYLNINANECVLIDDLIDNVNAAKLLGFNSYLIKKETFENNQILNYINKININIININENNYSFNLSKYSKYLSKAYFYLKNNNDYYNDNFLFKSMIISNTYNTSYLSESEIFTSLLILSNNKILSYTKKGKHILNYISKLALKNLGKFTFFNNKNILPFDLDTTCVALLLLFKHDKISFDIIEIVVKNILDNYYSENDKLFYTYFDKNRLRVCPLVNINVLNLILTYDKHKKLLTNTFKKDLKKNVINDINSLNIEYAIKSICNYLINDNFLSGTKYYPCPDYYIFSMINLYHKHQEKFNFIKHILKEKALESASNFKNIDDTLSLSIKNIISLYFNSYNEDLFQKLISMQNNDGSWKESVIFSNSSNTNKINWLSRSLNTSFGLKALEMKVIGITCFDI